MAFTKSSFAFTVRVTSCQTAFTSFADSKQCISVSGPRIEVTSDEKVEKLQISRGFYTRLHGMFVWWLHLTWNFRLIPKTIGNRKRDCAWGCARGINTTRENLQIEKHKSVRWAKRTPSWFVLCDLQIFSGGIYPPSATSRTISFSISHSFWY